MGRGGKRKGDGAGKQERGADGYVFVDSPTSYVESSATAGFAFGILASLRKKYIVGDKYEQAAYAAVKGIVERIQPSGELLDVRSVTMLSVFSSLVEGSRL